MAKTAAKGTIENPYSLSECDSMLDAGTWPGGYVKYDDGSVGYIPKGQAMVYGYSGSGSGSEVYGSDDYFSTGSDDWSGSDTDGEGSDDGGKAPVTGNEGGTGTGGNTGGTGGGHWSVGESSIGREKITSAATAYIGRNETDDIELIKKWLRNAGFPNPTNSTPWCAAFAYNMFQEAGYEGYKSASVKQWRANYGEYVKEPKVGDVVFFPNMSHIGIVAAVDGDNITVIHGNWSNKVSRTVHEKSYFDAYKRGK